MPRTTTTPPASRARPIDLEAFARDVAALRREILADLGEADLAHLRKIERWGRAATVVGLATAWAGPNPISVLGLALGRSTRWLLMHHVGHRGYDRVPGVPERYTSARFAKGWRRFVDWPDWIEPEAWKHEHNVLHHSFTGEETDPDLVERNTAWVRELPEPARWAVLALLTMTWRASYYAKNTLEEHMGRKGGVPAPGEVRRALLTKSLLPYSAYAFVGLPLVFAPLGPLAVGSAFLNSLLADVVTNAHTFLVVGPNHTGDDVYRFDDRPASKGEHYARQVLGSVNYATGGDLCDFAHLWLNYQIEHHLFPDVPMLQYRKVQPKVKALCARYGLPYVQESVLSRFAQLARVFVGRATMRRGTAGFVARDTEPAEAIAAE
jgi:fatty acid desaturase